MNVLALYNATQTYTNTVFEHADSFQRHSRHFFSYCHSDQYIAIKPDYRRFDAVVIHYSIRLPYDQIPEALAADLERYQGLKVLFIQDEYDHTHRTWHWIRRLGIHLVFTVVPSEGGARVYPPDQFPDTRFVSNLTGYVPEQLPAAGQFPPPSMRSLIVGYRARPLPMRYGQLGFEKVEIGRQIQNYCDQNAIAHDIAWSEDKRIYGAAWYQFMGSCKSMLGTESGSNVFDWDGTLLGRLRLFAQANPNATDDQIYAQMVQGLEIPGLMNQVSPRIFEAIALRTALVLYAGTYSGVIREHEHFIPVNKDGSNLKEVFEKLKDDAYVDAMTERAYSDVIGSGLFSYARFVGMVDNELDAGLVRLLQSRHSAASYSPVDVMNGRFAIGDAFSAEGTPPTVFTFRPIRTVPAGKRTIRGLIRELAYTVWVHIPERHRTWIRPIVRKILERG
jgi:hypothetical protein